MTDSTNDRDARVVELLLVALFCLGWVKWLLRRVGTPSSRRSDSVRIQATPAVGPATLMSAPLRRSDEEDTTAGTSPSAGASSTGAQSSRSPRSSTSFGALHGWLNARPDDSLEQVINDLAARHGWTADERIHFIPRIVDIRRAMIWDATARRLRISTKEYRDACRRLRALEAAEARMGLPAEYEYSPGCACSECTR